MTPELNVHFHALWADGAFECASRTPCAEADFHPDLSPTDADVARLACALRRRILRFLRRAGKLDEDDRLADLHDDEPPLLATLAAAAVQGRNALGPTAGAYARDSDVGLRTAASSDAANFARTSKGLRCTLASASPKTAAIAWRSSAATRRVHPSYTTDCRYGLTARSSTS